jgi:very-short-patch-repair endonuclease
MALWQALRARRLGGHKFRWQWSLYPYVADFCCLESRLIVEVDGSQHTPECDRARTAALQARGFRILRFWNNDVLTNMDGVLLVILEALGGAKEEDPHPTLSRKRERTVPTREAAAPLAPSPARGRRLG